MNQSHGAQRHGQSAAPSRQAGKLRDVDRVCLWVEASVAGSRKDCCLPRRGDALRENTHARDPVLVLYSELILWPPPRLAVQYPGMW